jgi:hypothetical protein
MRGHSTAARPELAEAGRDLDVTAAKDEVRHSRRVGSRNCRVTAIAKARSPGPLASPCRSCTHGLCLERAGRQAAATAKRQSPRIRARLLSSRVKARAGAATVDFSVPRSRVFGCLRPAIAFVVLPPHSAPSQWRRKSRQRGGSSRDSFATIAITCVALDQVAALGAKRPARRRDPNRRARAVRPGNQTLLHWCAGSGDRFHPSPGLQRATASATTSTCAQRRHQSADDGYGPGQR